MNHTKTVHNLMICFAMCASLIALSAKANEAELRERIMKKMGAHTTIDSIKKTPYGNLYEVYMNRKLHYTDQNFNFMIVGALIDTKKNINYSQKSLRKIESIPLSSLPSRQNAMLIRKGTSQQTLYVFSDPLCVHCQKLEFHLQKLPELTVYVYLIPNDRVNPGASRMASAIWCSNDPAKSYLNYMLKGIIPEALGQCRTPFETNQRISGDIGITGTPGIVFEDGYVITGAPNLQQLRKLLRESYENL